MPLDGRMDAFVDIDSLITTDDSIRHFAKTLGWSRVKRFQHAMPSTVSLPKSTIVWYESGHLDDICLFINTNYAAAVYALRYRIFTKWRAFTPYRSKQRVADEARRLEPWLHRRFFVRLEGRREFRKAHPECSSYSWDRIRAEPPTPLP